MPVGNDNTQHQSLGVIALCFPPVAVQHAIVSTVPACFSETAMRFD